MAPKRTAKGKTNGKALKRRKPVPVETPKEDDENASAGGGSIATIQYIEPVELEWPDGLKTPTKAIKPVPIAKPIDEDCKPVLPSDIPLLHKAFLLVEHNLVLINQIQDTEQIMWENPIVVESLFVLWNQINKGIHSTTSENKADMIRDLQHDGTKLLRFLSHYLDAEPVTVAG